MTILNAWISPTRALLAVDTLGTHPDGSKVEVAKFLTFPHSNCVIAGAGNSVLLYQLHHVLLQQRCDFDFIAEALPQLVEPVREQARKQAAEMGLGDDKWGLGQLIAVVGWSERRQAMQGFFQYADGDAAFCRPQQIEPDMLHPKLDDGWPDVTPNSEHAMLAAAQRQVAWGRKKYPHWHIGGRLIVAELEQGSMNISSLELS